jgi:hypothetical protein
MTGTRHAKGDPLVSAQVCIFAYGQTGSGKV